MKPSIPIAVSTGSLYPTPTLGSLQMLRGLGLQDVELTLQTNEFSLTFERKLSMPILPELLALVQAGDLCVRSVHAPNVPAQHANILWARKEYLSHSIEICRLLGGSLVVIHPLHLLITQEAALDYLSSSNGISLESIFLPDIMEVLEQAQSANITLALENTQEWFDEPFFNHPENVSKFFREMKHPALGFTFDLMHAQVVGFLNDFADLLADEIVNVHVSDLQPPLKRVAVGKGNIDWPHVMSTLQNWPNVRQMTVELSRPKLGELSQSVSYLSSFLPN